MNPEQLRERLAALCAESLPLPGSGETPQRHQRLMQTGREDLSLAKLMEAHWDALSILGESGRSAAPGALYAVWASEMPTQALRLEPRGGASLILSGEKPFCSGAGIADFALVTVTVPEQVLVEVDLRDQAGRVEFHHDGWKTDAFRSTRTGSVTFNAMEISKDAIIGEPGWYVNRPGFWHGACGPAACWAGGAASLLDFAVGSHRDDPHTLAHLGAMHASVWGMRALLDVCGREIDTDPCNRIAAQARALQLRHLVEQASTDILHRFARAYGPYPLAMHADTATHYHELNLYLRQSHGERDLESLARTLKEFAAMTT